MDRLTKRDVVNGRNGIWVTEGYEYTGLKTFFGEDEEGYSAIEKCAAYEDAEEQGLLVRLPCKVGDKVYKIWNCGKNGKSVAEFEIKHIDIDFLPEIEFSFIKAKGDSYWFCKASDIGKTVFLTREEEEQALREMRE